MCWTGKKLWNIFSNQNFFSSYISSKILFSYFVSFLVKMGLVGMGFSHYCKFLLVPVWKLHFPLFLTDKFPWLFQYFFNVLSFKIQFVWKLQKKNYRKSWKKVKIKISKISCIFQYFVYISPTFSNVFKIPWFFLDRKILSYFSSQCGNHV